MLDADLAEFVLPPRDPSTLSEHERLVSTPEASERFRREVERMIDDEIVALLYDWDFWRRPSQVPPDGRWSIWEYIAGRGTGKTRTGAEETRRRVKAGDTGGHVHLIGATAADVRDVMVEGPTGILAVSPRSERPKYEPSKRRLSWPNGTVGTTFTADEPDRLRGPQCGWLWADEAAAWRFPLAFDMALLGLRLGSDPRGMMTTTPKPVRWLMELGDTVELVRTGGATWENAANLPPPFLQAILRRYGGTRLGLQEIDAVFLEEAEGALWKRAVIERNRVATWPGVTSRDWRRIVSVDPPSEMGAECGIVCVGGPTAPTPESHAYVLDDRSLYATPEEWARVAIACLRDNAADVILVESNQGGDMVRATIHAIDSTAPVRKHRAKVGKGERAEPVSAKYERDRVHHVGVFAMLETQMTQWVPGEGKSPDRVDALVHGIAELLPDDRLPASSTVPQGQIPTRPGSIVRLPGH